MVLLAVAVGGPVPTMAQVACNGVDVVCSGDVQLNAGGQDVIVGNVAPGSMIVDGASITGTLGLWVGWEPGVTGTLSIKGGANWIHDSNFSTGFQGNGTIEIIGAGTALTSRHMDLSGACPCPVTVGDDPGATGSLTVRDGAQLNVIDGPGYNDSTTGPGLNGELNIGQYGSGELVVSNGGQVHAAAIGIGSWNAAGSGVGAAGDATVDGVGSLLVSDTLLAVGVEIGTEGSLVVSNGGAVVVKGDPDDPKGYAWQEATFTIGEQGSGRLDVLDGGTVTIDRGGVVSTSGLPNGMLIGGTLMPGPAPGTGEVVVDGAGSRIDISGGAARILVGGGDNGTGRLEIRNGGVVALENSGIPGDFTEVLLGDPYGLYTEAALVVDGAGSKLQAGDAVTCGRTGDATMAAKSGGEIHATYLFVGANCVASGDGSYLGNIVVEPGGTVSPGNSPGNMTVTGDVEMESGGRLRFEVDGLSVAQYDTLTAAGGVNFNPGSVVEIILDTTTVSLAQLSTLKLIEAASVTGETEVVAIDTGGSEIQRVVVDDVEAAGGIAAAFSGGTTIDDLCPCGGPAGSSRPWKNHGKYVSCVAHAAGDLVKSGQLDASETGSVVSEAARSSCGK